MRAVGLYKYLPIENEESLLDVELGKPTATGRDVLVGVKAISVNPLDTKIRSPKDNVESAPKILGWDAAGEVVAIGDEVEHYKVGDKVFYAGDVTRSGSNAEYQLVDERIVGKKPTSLDYSAAAALPVASITAWEAMFDRMGIATDGSDEGKSILIIGGAGGVGSIAIQLAKKIAKLNVITTASRPETIEWTKKFGADYVVNHRNALDEEIKAIGFDHVDYIMCLNSTEQHWEAMANAIVPQGVICSIVDTAEPVNLNLLKPKSVSFVWEFMFTRAMFQTKDMIEHQNLLNIICQMIDAGELMTTVNEIVSPINAVNLRRVHADIEAGASIGKRVLAGWE